MAEFIYQPRSGSQIFADQRSAEIVVVTWPNGSRHVLGGQLLVVEAATPGAWWRDKACTMAKAIVQAVGGVSWDDKGTVCLVVPRHLAWAALAQFECLAPYGTETFNAFARQRANFVAASLAGFYTPADGAEVLEPFHRQAEAQPLTWQLEDGTVTAFGPDGNVVDTARYSGQFPREISGGTRALPEE